MVDVETDRHEFTIEIIAHGNLSVQNVNVPATGFIDEAIVVNYDVINNGGTDTCYGRLVEVVDGNETEKDRWDDSIGGGATRYSNHTLTPPHTIGQKIYRIIVGRTHE